MNTAISLPARTAVVSVIFLVLFASKISVAQEPSDVVRVNTQMVQTDVLVLNKAGEFVDGLRPEQFQLRVNNRLRTISSLDRVTSGIRSQEERMAAARGQATNSSSHPDRGRTILFYLDDYHLSVNSINRTRVLLKDFVEHQTNRNDQVALITATGQLGFLEQFASDPAVIQRGIERLGHRSFSTADAERTPMSETEATAINNEDRRVLDYYVDQLLKETGQRPRGVSTPASKSRAEAESVVRSRARSIIDQSTTLSVATLAGLERLIRMTAGLPWRKNVFFISDGFVMHEPTNPGLDLQRIANAAAQAATVIYAVDAEGLITATPDTSRKMTFNIGRLTNINNASIEQSQEPLQTLAVDSGGKAILNTNDPIKDLDRALNESSNYYLLSWRPDEKDVDHGFESMQISVVGRPDLLVRMRHGYSIYPLPPETSVAKKPSAKKKNEETESPLVAALRGLAPRLDLPVSLSAGYSDVGDRTAMITATIEVPLESLSANSQSTDSTQLELMGASIDERGRAVGTFTQSLTVKTSEIKAAQSRRVLYSHQFKLPAGLYQIRVAAQEKDSTRLGTATEWIEVPDLSLKNFFLSSLFVGEIDKSALETGKLSVNASHRFSAGSRLGFFLTIYNASRGNAADLVLQVQVFRDQQPVVTIPLVKVDAQMASDPARISYGEDLPLTDLPAGDYLLSVTVIDRIAKTFAQQRIPFVIF